MTAVQLIARRFMLNQTPPREDEFPKDDCCKQTFTPTIPLMSVMAMLHQSLQYNPECVRRAANDTAILLSDCRRLLSHHNCRTDSLEHRTGNGRERRYGVGR
jgi:hypothetical protein